MATETKTTYDTLILIGNNKMDPLHVTRLDELCIRLSVKTEGTFQVLSPELLMYVLCERTPIAKTAGVYNERELNDDEEQCIVHGCDFGTYFSWAIPKKKTGDASIKVEKGIIIDQERKQIQDSED